MSLWTYDRFYPKADELRAEFEENFRDPESIHPERFAWDYWHVPGRYTHLRTPAHLYFAPKTYKNFEKHLLTWAQENLGCHSMTPPWLSLYVDGCEQKMHSDLPHGAWAFVFSLCPSKLEFSGGDTFLLKPKILDFWSHWQNFDGLNEEDCFRHVRPKFNRLIVFDPRTPHGVSLLSGAKDPRKGRLVVHGWFTSPHPFVQGLLTQTQAAATINPFLQKMADQLAAEALPSGPIVLRLSVAASGRVQRVETLAESLQSNQPQNRAQLVRFLKAKLIDLEFKRSRSSSTLVLPLQFQ